MIAIVVCNNEPSRPGDSGATDLSVVKVYEEYCGNILHWGNAKPLTRMSTESVLRKCMST